MSLALGRLENWAFFERERAGGVWELLKNDVLHRFFICRWGLLGLSRTGSFYGFVFFF